MRLVKSRTCDRRALDYGSYMLLDGDRVVMGAPRQAFGDSFRPDMTATLDAIEASLTRDR